MSNSTITEKLFGGNLILRIAIGIAAGILLALAWPSAAKSAMLFGTLFVQALKAVAPVLVLFLVAAALAKKHKGGNPAHGLDAGQPVVDESSAEFRLIPDRP